jgi:ABC-type transporter Mla subunit MlaD
VRRRRASSIAANPVLVGAVTVLVVTVAVFLAYNANHGLPFVPTTDVRVQLDSGANLLPGGDVKIGGQRVGVVSELRPVRLRGGEVGAELLVRLDRVAGDVPVDSTWRVRPRSPLGLKYVELTRGRSREVLRAGDVVPAGQTSAAAELADYQGIFDAETRRAVAEVTTQAGTSLALRGADLNEAIAEAPRLMRHLEPVARTLAAPDTRLRRMLRELGDGARVVRDVAEPFARSFTTGAEVYEAWSRDEDALSATVRLSPPSMEAAIPSLRAQRPLLAALERQSTALRRLAAALPTAAPPLTAALRAGTGPLRRSPAIYRGLEANAGALRALVRDPAFDASILGLRRLGAEVLRPLTRHVGPYITVCNYFNYSFTHLGEHVSEPDSTGTQQRTLSNQASRPADPTAPSIGSIGATRPVNGEPTLTGVPMHFHGQPYGAAVAADGAADCEAGQRGYMERLHAYSPDPNLKIVRDAHVPGNQGTTFTGRPRVPAGQTFDRNPQIGPPLPPEVEHP